MKTKKGKGNLLDKLEKFLTRVMSEIDSEPDFENSARLAEWLASYLWANTCGIYRFDKIEEMVLSKYESYSTNLQRQLTINTELHVASKIFRSGGHTALMSCLIKEKSDPTHVMLTRDDNVQDAADILGINSKRVKGINPAESALSRIKILTEEILSHNNIVLHIHPDDVIAATAVKLAKKINPNIVIIFANHADHVFSVGLSAVDKVLEISIYGWLLRNQRMTMEKSSFMGIPISPPKEFAPVLDSKNILTGGAAYKFRPVGEMSLPKFLTKLLKLDSTLSLTVIGASGKDWWWWPMRIRFGKRVKLHKTVSKEVYSQFLRACTLYIDSYPWLGGTAFPEALMMGCRVSGLRGVAWGYSCADQLRSSDETFITNCLKLIKTDTTAMLDQQMNRQRCVQYHAPATVRERMDSFVYRDQLVLPPIDQLTNPPQRIVESFWLKDGKSILPSRKKIALTHTEIKALFKAHVKSFGLTNWSSFKLFFYGYLKK